MPNQWQAFIESESQQQYYSELMGFLETEAQAGKVIYPPQDEVFSAFKLTPLSQTKVVIIGYFVF
ncbi:hypothetical protein D5018_08515 [Parashewanella curva]|uniref:Uracil-DNA glycosylase n=1 Tax=Parashewanella curva TaxID=2338552 RepID=A0A3L8PXI0_9GAMM|nr:hypothetical protein [Parashewanella curva]RLV60167.1 hypothetical protein D5018_08515 [Parashewanella curva]